MVIFPLRVNIADINKLFLDKSDASHLCDLNFPRLGQLCISLIHETQMRLS